MLMKKEKNTSFNEIIKRVKELTERTKQLRENTYKK